MLSTSIPLDWIFFSVISVLGGGLLVWGMRGRRVGDEPRCRKCDYDLTGLPEEQCPECGRSATGRNVVLGHRKRFRRTIALGLGLLCLASMLWGVEFYGRLKGVTWYRYYPDYLLLQSAKEDDHLAIKEVSRRLSNKALSESELVSLLPGALASQGSAEHTRSAWAWTDVLASMDGLGLLTKEQQQQFYDQVVQVKLEFRPRIHQGEDLSLKFGHWIRGSPSITTDCRFENVEFRIGSWSKTLMRRSLENSLAQQGAGGSMGFPIPTDQFEVGTHKVECWGTKVFLCGNDSNWSKPSFTKDIRLTYDLEVLSPSTPDTVEFVNDPKMAEEYLKAITINLTDEPFPGDTLAPGQVSVEYVVSGAVPMDTVFVVKGLVGKREVDLGVLEVRQSEGTGSRRSRHIRTVDIGYDDSVVPILRSNADRARATDDMFKIWNGEVRLEPISLQKVSE